VRWRKEGRERGYSEERRTERKGEDVHKELRVNGFEMRCKRWGVRINSNTAVRN
jgi:hypothetical protein